MTLSSHGPTSGIAPLAPERGSIQKAPRSSDSSGDKLLDAVLAACASNQARAAVKGGAARAKAPAVSAHSPFNSVAPTVGDALRIVYAAYQSTGVEIPFTTFCEPGPVGQVCAELLAGTHRTPLCVLLQEGTANAPGHDEATFLLSGLSGAVLELRPLAQAMAGAGPVFGLAYPGLDGKEPPCKTTQELIERLFEAEVRPRLAQYRRVHFVGYSMGSSMAVQLGVKTPPEKRGLIGLIDAPLHPRHWPLAAWLKYVVHTAFAPPRTRQAREQKQADHDGERPYERREQRVSLVTRVTNKLAGRAKVVSNAIKQRYSDIEAKSFIESFPFHATGLPPAFQAVRNESFILMARALPDRYDGLATFFNTGETDMTVRAPGAMWSQVTPNMRVVKVGGLHVSILRPPEVARLGQAIRAEQSAIPNG